MYVCAKHLPFRGGHSKAQNFQNDKQPSWKRASFAKNHMDTIRQSAEKSSIFYIGIFCRGLNAIC